MKPKLEKIDSSITTAVTQEWLNTKRNNVANLQNTTWTKLNFSFILIKPASIARFEKTGLNKIYYAK